MYSRPFCDHSNLHITQLCSQYQIDLPTSTQLAIPGLRCPCCESELTTTQTEYKIDHFGSALLILSKCHKCGYKHNDVYSLETREPIVVKARISSPDDLKIKVIKSGSATIKIPEFGATITPGPFSEGFITNVEGVLSRIEGSLAFMLHSAEPERVVKGEKLLKKIRLARKSPHFTLTIVDPLGNSEMISSTPSKIVRRKLSKRELRAAGFRQDKLNTSNVTSG